MNRILIVEDDHQQVELIEKALHKEPQFAGSDTKIQRISTERQFVDGFNEISSNPPHVILMDVMLRWDDPSPDFQLPKGYEGFHRAGLRNTEILAKDQRTRNIPVILYTLLTEENLKGIPERPNVFYLSKVSTLEPMVQLVRSVITENSG
jgi:CheY-like chemotaxis protein